MSSQPPPPTFSSSSSSYRFPPGYEYEEYSGVEIIPVFDRRLEAVDISSVALANYRADKSFSELVKYTGFVTFAHDLQHKNRLHILDRPTTEACWMRLVTKSYQKWDRASVNNDPDVRFFPFRLKVSILDEAQNQVSILSSHSHLCSMN